MFSTLAKDEGSCDQDGTHHAPRWFTLIPCPTLNKHRLINSLFLAEIPRTITDLLSVRRKTSPLDLPLLIKVEGNIRETSTEFLNSAFFGSASASEIGYYRSEEYNEMVG